MRHTTIITTRTRRVRHTHVRHTTLGLTALLLLTVTAACTMTANAPDPTRPPFAPTYEVFNTPFVIPSATPLPTAISSPTSIPPTVNNCTPYNHWPAITVEAGDTLGDIATRTNSTIEQLTQANCLADPSLIYVGQTLYVPVLPATQTPAATATLQVTADPRAPVFTQPLTVNQHWVRNDGKPVTYYASVRVTVDVVNNASHVNFYVNDPGGGSAVFIGQDADPWDGAWVDYTFTGPGEFTFQARAVNEHMEIPSNAFTVVYDPNYTPPGEVQFNRLEINPRVSFADGWYHLTPGTTVTITWPHAPVGAERVEFRVAPTGTGTGPGQLIAQDLTPIDGSAVTWIVPGAITAHIEAIAYMPDNSTQSATIANVYAE